MAREADEGREARGAAVTIAATLGALAFALAVVAAAWVTPDKGFHAFTGRRVVEVSPGGPAARAGLAVGDVIVAARGRPVESTLDYVREVLAPREGRALELRVWRGGAERQVLILPDRAGPPVTAIVALVLAVTLLGLGLVARLGRPRDGVSRRFWRTTLVYAVVYTGALCYRYIAASPILAAVALAAVFLAPPVAMDLTLAFPRRVPGEVRWLRLAAWVPALVLGLGTFTALGVAAARVVPSGEVDGLLRWAVRLVTAQLAFAIPVLAAGLVVQVRALRRAPGEERGQFKWLAFGFIVAALPAVLAVPAAVRNLDRFLTVDYRPYVAAMAVTYFGAATLAVLRVRLADVDTVIDRSVTYAVASAVAIGAYFAAALGLGLVASHWLGPESWVAHVAGVVAAAALFGPVRTRAARWIDRRFHRDRLHYVEALHELAEAVQIIRAPKQLVEEVVDRTVAALRARAGAFLLPSEETPGRFTVACVRGDLTLRAELDEADALEAPPHGLAVPVRARERLAGVLLIGPRLGGDLYSSADRHLLAALASQLAAALDNARAFSTIEELTRQLGAQNRQILDLRDRLEDENRYLKGRLHATISDDTVALGGSRAARELRRQVERVARSNAVVLIRGETGTGKSLLAREIHQRSERAEGPFIHVDLGSIPQGVFESELFGHERGAFTGAVRARRGLFELAEGGTLFLDEVGELPLEMQPKLLRALQERSFPRVGGDRAVAVDVRIVAATNRDLQELVRTGRFREDLYYRFSVVEVEVPPLRARRADLPELVDAVLPRLCRRNHRPSRRLSPAAMERLEAYGWPGNVRELENVLERAVVLGESPEIGPEDLVLPDARGGAVFTAEVSLDAETEHRDVMEAIERERIAAALRVAGGNRSSAARALGMPRTTLLHKMRRYRLMEN